MHLPSCSRCSTVRGLRLRWTSISWLCLTSGPSPMTTGVGSSHAVQGKRREKEKELNYLCSLLTNDCKRFNSDLTTLSSSTTRRRRSFTSSPILCSVQNISNRRKNLPVLVLKCLYFLFCLLVLAIRNRSCSLTIIKSIQRWHLASAACIIWFAGPLGSTRSTYRISLLRLAKFSAICFSS